MEREYYNEQQELQYIRDEAAKVSPEAEEAIKKYFAYKKGLPENPSGKEMSEKRKLQEEVLCQLSRMFDKDSNNKISKEEIDDIHKISQTDIATSPERYFELLAKAGRNNSCAAHLLSFLFSEMAKNEPDENVKNIFNAKAVSYKSILLFK